MGTPKHAAVRTFLIADIRGYTRFTEEYGDEASARLAAKFSDLVEEGARLRGGTLIEIRGDEALVVFESARQAIRAAMDLQRLFREETDADSDLPLNVGIGIDSGEAIPLEDGSFRGAALNVAARLCAMAHGGEVIVSEGTSHLAGRLPGVRYVDRGRAHLKGIADPVRVVRAAPEEERRAGVIALIPADLSKHCVTQPVGNVGAVGTAVCVPPADGRTGFSPDRWEVSIYPGGRALREAYEAERRGHQLATGEGKCNRLTWGGEGPWSHGPGKPGGRRLCYFDRNDAVIVWSHERLGQPSHRDILAVAREGGSDHARLTSWWGYAHHLIGKLE
jgi:class 3 adenylate cyclase